MSDGVESRMLREVMARTGTDKRLASGDTCQRAENSKALSQSGGIQSAVAHLVDLADELTRLRTENADLRDSCAANADRIDRLGETVVRLSATLKQAREALDLAVSSHGLSLLTDPPKDAWKARRVSEIARAALSAIDKVQP